MLSFPGSSLKMVELLKKQNKKNPHKFCTYEITSCYLLLLRSVCLEHVIMCSVIIQGFCKGRNWDRPIPGDAMRILEITTCEMACCAAFEDSPKRFPFSSITGMPCFSSLRMRRSARDSWLSIKPARTSDSTGRLPLPHQGNVDTVSSSHSGERHEASYQRGDVLREKTNSTDSGTCINNVRLAWGQSQVFK